MGWGRFDNSFIRGGGKTYAVGLMIAAIKGHTEIVKHLPKINANKNARYVFGYTALDFAKIQITSKYINC